MKQAQIIRSPTIKNKLPLKRNRYKGCTTSPSFPLWVLALIYEPQLRLNYSKAKQSLVAYLSDLIRCFFIAATDSNTLLCKNGLKMLKRVIILFKDAPDPDVEDSNLLEQYQANIGAALRKLINQLSKVKTQKSFFWLFNQDRFLVF